MTQPSDQPRPPLRNTPLAPSADTTDGGSHFSNPKLNPDHSESSPPASPPSDGSGQRSNNYGDSIDSRSDERLLADYRSGDTKAFPLLMQRYQRELYHFLVRFLGDRAAAEDIFQEAFLQVHQSADQFDIERRFKPWLFTIAANKARDLLRAQSRRPTSPLQASISPGDDDANEFLSLMASEQDTPETPLQDEELRQKVRNVVMSMPANLREILLLSYFHQFPYKHISDILGIPLGTVKSRLHAAVAHFGSKWKNSNPPPTAS